MNFTSRSLLSEYENFGNYNKLLFSQIQNYCYNNEQQSIQDAKNYQKKLKDCTITN